MKVYKKKLKSLKMDAISESRQGALAVANSNFTTANYNLNVAKANFTAAKNLRI